MTVYNDVCSSTRPLDVEVTNTSVFVASNITEYTQEIEGHSRTGYRYNLTEYTKDEYLLSQGAMISTL